MPMPGTGPGIVPALTNELAQRAWMTGGGSNGIGSL